MSGDNFGCQIGDQKLLLDLMSRGKDTAKCTGQPPKELSEIERPALAHSIKHSSCISHL